VAMCSGSPAPVDQQSPSRPNLSDFKTLWVDLGQVRESRFYRDPMTIVFVESPIHRTDSKHANGQSYMLESETASIEDVTRSFSHLAFPIRTNTIKTKKVTQEAVMWEWVRVIFFDTII
jgi:hypothetical protein